MDNSSSFLSSIYHLKIEIDLVKYNLEHNDSNSAYQHAKNALTIQDENNLVLGLSDLISIIESLLTNSNRSSTSSQPSLVAIDEKINNIQKYIDDQIKLNVSTHP